MRPSGNSRRSRASIPGIAEVDAPLPRPTPRARANLNFLLENDTRAVNDYQPDLEELRAAPTRIVAAGGRSSGGSASRRCAEELAARLGTTLAEFPGGHTGWLLRPKEFAARLLDVLQEEPSAAAAKVEKRHVRSPAPEEP